MKKLLTRLLSIILFLISIFAIPYSISKCIQFEGFNLKTILFLILFISESILISVLFFIISFNSGKDILNRYFNTWFQKNKIIIFSKIVDIFLVLNIIFLLLEIKSINQEKYKTSIPFHRIDKKLGYSLIPGIETISIKKNQGGKEAYRVKYRIDNLGRRNTVHNNINNKTNYILFFGGSVTFGEGVPDDKTIASHIELFLPNYKAYNYGVEGYGTANVLMKMSMIDRNKEIPEKRGYCIYIYIDDHINRTIGSLSTYFFGYEFPCYIYEDNRLVYKGSFREYYPLKYFFYTYSGIKIISTIFHFNIPNNYRDNDFHLTARVIEEIYKKYKTKFNDSKFYILFYPGTITAKRMKRLLDKYQIKYIDFSRLFNFWGSDKYHLLDGHPSPLANRIIASNLSNYIKKTE